MAGSSTRFPAPRCWVWLAAPLVAVILSTSAACTKSDTTPGPAAPPNVGSSSDAAGAPSGSAPAGTTPGGERIPPTGADDLNFTVGASGGTFVVNDGGIATGTLTGVADKTKWTNPDRGVSGEASTPGLAKTLVDETSPAVLHVLGAAESQDVVALEVDKFSYDDATDTVTFSGVPSSVETNATALKSDPSLPGRADPSVASTFQAAEMTVSPTENPVDDKGEYVPNDNQFLVVMLGLGPNVKVTWTLSDSHCVHSADKPDWTTGSWADLKAVNMDASADFFSGCSTSDSWARYNVSVGAPWNDSGTIWLGQNNAGGTYYAKCSGWGQLVCTGESPYEQTRGLQLLAPRCRENQIAPGRFIYYQDPGVTCSMYAPQNWGKGSFNRWTPDVIARDRYVRVINVSRQSCSIENSSRHQEIVNTGATSDWFREGDAIKGYADPGYCSFVVRPD